MPFIPIDPPPPKDSIDDADMIPEMTAGWFSIVTFSWITSLLALGYARPLEAPDLYKLQDNRSAAVIAEKINNSFEARRKVAEEYNTRLASGEISAGWRKVWWTLRGNRAEHERQWREKDGRRQPSLMYAINDSVKYWFWSGGIMKVSGDTVTILTPLVVKVRQQARLVPITSELNLFSRPSLTLQPSLTSESYESYLRAMRIFTFSTVLTVLAKSMTFHQ
jgi:hypothetical protein